jgi:undecaprenyl-diphosphatase
MRVTSGVVFIAVLEVCAASAAAAKPRKPPASQLAAPASQPASASQPAAASQPAEPDLPETAFTIQMQYGWLTGMGPESQETAPTASTQRAKSLEPKPVLPPPPKQRFEAEPIHDGAILAISVGFAGILELINSTGEVHPQQISPNFDINTLLWIDRPAVTQTIDPNASTLSNIGLLTMIGYAVLDPILTIDREDSEQAGLVDGIIYAESLSVTWGMTNLAKIAVRRPRPIEYIEVMQHAGDPNFTVSTTDSSQSFFSGHAAICAATTATATYLAFARSPDTIRPWLTLGIGTAVTAFVGYERVRAGMHFPTDVIAGTLAGAGIGVLVTHFHRAETEKQRAIWIGFGPTYDGSEGGALTLSGLF